MPAPEYLQRLLSGGAAAELLRYISKHAREHRQLRGIEVSALEVMAGQIEAIASDLQRKEVQWEDEFDFSKLMGCRQIGPHLLLNFSEKLLLLCEVPLEGDPAMPYIPEDEVVSPEATSTILVECTLTTEIEIVAKGDFRSDVDQLEHLRRMILDGYFDDQGMRGLMRSGRSRMIVDRVKKIDGGQEGR